mmetsp:Transcript_69099/g.133390  ORF Transcript_69099/g.133390 Transcript_69099/m.133390 type:complete len:205 (-) Transcript_69099:52-666(-)
MPQGLVEFLSMLGQVVAIVSHETLHGFQHVLLAQMLRVEQHQQQRILSVRHALRHHICTFLNMPFQQTHVKSALLAEHAGNLVIQTVRCIQGPVLVLLFWHFLIPQAFQFQLPTLCSLGLVLAELCAMLDEAGGSSRHCLSRQVQRSEDNLEERRVREVEALRISIGTLLKQGLHGTHVNVLYVLLYLVDQTAQFPSGVEAHLH